MGVDESYLLDFLLILPVRPNSPSICPPVAKFGDPNSPYQVALAKRVDEKYPVPGPWLQSGIVKALKNIEAGTKPSGAVDALDNDGFTTSLPAFLAQSELATDVARLVTTSPVALEHLRLQSSIVENYLNGVEDPVNSAAESMAAELPDLVQEVKDVTAAVADESKSVPEMVAEFGKACPLPGSFKSGLAVLLRSKDYVSAVRQNILSCGDCNARANFIGACLGAKEGIEGIPLEWIKKVR